MKKKRLFAGVCTDIGTTRKVNQDNFFLNGTILRNCYMVSSSARDEFDEGVFAVADGMGGESHGEFASRTVVESLLDLSNRGKIEYEDVNRVIDKANSIICRKITETKKNIGTTIVMAVIRDNQVDVYNIGDSKCFLYRDGSLIRLSKDHTVTAQMVEANLMTEEQARTDKRKHQLLQHLGIFPEDMALSLFSQDRFSLKKDDIILLCSDGLTDGLEEDEIIDVIETTRSVSVLAPKLVRLAIENGSTDNTTAMVIKALSDKSRMLKVLLYTLACFCTAALGAVSALVALNIFK